MKRGIENNQPFVILHIKNDDPFTCRTYKNEFAQPSYYVCTFGKLPNARLQKIQNDFFTITFDSDKDIFFSRIVPKKRSRIFPLPPPVYKNSILDPKSRKKTRHWMILGYDEHLPYLEKRALFDDYISFPLDLKEYAIPSVGAVDINGNPLFMKNNRDVERFISIKKMFKSKKFKKVYEMATKAQKAYPDSIFASDFLRYRIKALAEDDMKEHAEEIIKLGKLFVKRFSSDEYLPEILLILARVYSAVGQQSDANYFFDRLIGEHKESRYADLGLIYLGDQLYINGKTKEAIKRYLEAYYNSKDIDIASLAAYKLAIRYLGSGKTKKGVEYLRKIWRKNPGFILKDKEDAHGIAKQLAANNVMDFAIEIDKALLKKLKKLDELYEQIVFEIAQWYDKKGDIKKAINWYERYIKEFSYGEFTEKARKSLDELFVIQGDANASKALEKFEYLMREYKNGPIAEKALAAKAKLLLAQKRYGDVLKLAQIIKEIKDSKAKEAALDSLKKAADAMFESSAKKKECKVSIEMIEKYGVEPQSDYDEFIFGCYEKYARYSDALKIAQKHIYGTKVQQRSKWLCKILHVLTLSGSFDKAGTVAYDLFSLSGERTYEVCPTFDWDMVKVLDAAKEYAKEISLIKKMSRHYSNDMRMAEVYRIGYDAAKKRGDVYQQKWMLEKLVTLQRLKRSHPYSPWAEFELIKILKKEKNLKAALEVAKSMDRLKLKGEKRARWLYELASIYDNLGDNRSAVKSFKECAVIERGGAWGQLCKEALSDEQ